MTEPTYRLTQKGMRIVHLGKVNPDLSLDERIQLLDAIEEADKAYVECEERTRS